MSKTEVQVETIALKAINSRQDLLMQIRGQIAHLPNLKPIFADWEGIQKPRISPFVPVLREKVTERLQLFNFEASKHKRLIAADFALFTGLWWPDAPFKQLEILAYLVIWLFTWDDEIDEPTGFCSDNFSAAQTYRVDTLRFVAQCLGLLPGKSQVHPRNQIIMSFEKIGCALKSSYSINQCRRFYVEIARFMAASEDEQRARLTGRIPTLEEYWSFRLGTSAVYIGTAAAEYSTGSQLPPEIMDCTAMQVIWKETNIIISLTNDLLSLKKEMKLGCIDSVVPLTFNCTRDVNKAIGEAVAALQCSRKRFDQAADELHASTAKDKEIYQQISAFIDVQRSNCVGNLIWSLQTHRYGMWESMNDDGSQSFTL